jgi:prepilin-type N-terminal cleavage/methylation domain-containing protein
MTFLTKKRQLTKKTKGFTLIELLVVIAIIGVLASIVLASLNTARLKSRDTRRIADMNQAKLALQLYYDSNRQYPILTTTTGFIPTFIGTWPGDPITGTGYTYFPAIDATGVACTGSCQFFHTGAGVEDPKIAAMGSDADRCADTSTSCVAGNGATTILTGTTVRGADGISGGVLGTGSDCAVVAAGRGCYDVTP